MRHTLAHRLVAAHVRRASPTTLGPASKIDPLKPNPIALLPPIPLYRRLFRAHRKQLRSQERVLGDQYIKSEFRAHRNVENPLHIVGFLTEWQLYAQKLEGDAWHEEKLEQAKVEKMNDEQIGQLYELMRAIQGKSEEDGGGSQL